MKEYVKDAKINKTSKVSRHIVLDKNEGLPLFLGNQNVPDEIPVRVTYTENEIVIKRRG